MQQRLDSLVADSRGLICAFGLAPLERLERDDIVALDDERKAAMVSNLLVVLCSGSRSTPVINTGTLYG